MARFDSVTSICCVGTLSTLHTVIINNVIDVVIKIDFFLVFSFSSLSFINIGLTRKH